ncbi:MAG: hypothetical protein M3353_02535 [Actinomycetota bacterium]|nr:hypothetical protein [Actinomycetota bacterium]
MQKLTAELVIMFYALAVTVYALAVIGAGIYATVTNANGLEVLWLIALTLPSSIVYLALEVPGTRHAFIVTLVLTGLLQAAGCAAPLVAGRKYGAGN